MINFFDLNELLGSHYFGPIEYEKREIIDVDYEDITDQGDTRVPASNDKLLENNESHVSTNLNNYQN